MSEPKDQSEPEFLLSRYLDGDLPGRRRRRLEDRLAEDHALREELRRYEALEDALGRLGDAQVAGDDEFRAMREDVSSALQRKIVMRGLQRDPVRWGRPVLGALAAAATVTLVALATLSWLANDSTETEPSLSDAAVLPVYGQPRPVDARAEASMTRLEWSEVPLSPDPASVRADAMPAGSMILSVGPPRRTRATVTPAALPGIQ